MKVGGIAAAMRPGGGAGSRRRADPRDAHVTPPQDGMPSVRRRPPERGGRPHRPRAVRTRSGRSHAKAAPATGDDGSPSHGCTCEHSSSRCGDGAAANAQQSGDCVRDTGVALRAGIAIMLADEATPLQGLTRPAECDAGHSRQIMLRLTPHSTRVANDQADLHQRTGRIRRA
jgi:hypothetical protein